MLHQFLFTESIFLAQTHHFFKTHSSVCWHLILQPDSILRLLLDYNTYKTQVLCSTWLPFAFQIERISYQFCCHSADILRFYHFLRRVLNWTPLKLNTTQWHRANKTYYIPSRSIFKARISIFNFFSGCVWVKSTVPRWQFVFKCSFVDRLREWHSPPTAGKT